MYLIIYTCSFKNSNMVANWSNDFDLNELENNMGADTISDVETVDIFMVKIATTMISLKK